MRCVCQFRQEGDGAGDGSRTRLNGLGSRRTADVLHPHGAPGGARTPGLRIRSPLLYPSELQAHGAGDGSRTHSLPLRRRPLYPLSYTDGIFWRRVRDSNPGRLAPRWFSRPVHSTALPTLHGPAGQIRTGDPLIPNQVRCQAAPQPDGGLGGPRTHGLGIKSPLLCHLSYESIHDVRNPASWLGSVEACLAQRALAWLSHRPGWPGNPKAFANSSGSHKLHTLPKLAACYHESAGTHPCRAMRQGSGRRSGARSETRTRMPLGERF